MYRISTLAGVAVLGLALLVGTSASQGTKKSSGQLPSGWGKLGLSKEQKTKIYAVQAEYKSKIAELEKQLDDLKAEQRRKMAAVLTEQQKEKLRRLATGEGSTPSRQREKDK